MSAQAPPRNHFAIKLLLGAVVLATLTTGVLVALTFKSSGHLVELQQRNEEIVRLQGVATHYDEVLTMSARMAAATGDTRWERRYREFEPVLDRAIKRLIELQPKELKAAEQTDAANRALVEMENKALGFVAEGKPAEASLTLFSADYEKQKEIYARGTTDFYRDLEVGLVLELAKYKSHVEALQIALFIFLATSFAGWIVVLQRIRSWNAELKLVNEKLDQQVKEQTALLLNSSKMSALGEMAGGVAHEINTPLAIIGLRIDQMEECVREGDLEAIDVLDTIAVIKKTVTRISKIVSGMRSFARDGKSVPTQLVPVSKLIEETLSFCGERFGQHGVRLNIVENPAFRSSQLECRAVEISQVLLNLLNNAHDAVAYLDEKWVRVEVSETESLVEISVTDSGRGIPKDIADKIMQPFFTTKEVGKGTGLGLSISNGIVVSHQGKIYVDTDCANTKFTVVLPKTQAQLFREAA